MEEKLYGYSMPKGTDKDSNRSIFTHVIASNISTILKQKSMTQRELAQKMGKTEQEIGRLLSGKHNFTIASIADISLALDQNVLMFQCPDMGVDAGVALASEEAHQYYTQPIEPLNKYQVQILNYLRDVKNAAEANDIIALISDYYSSKSLAELDKLNAEGALTPEMLTSWYKQRCQKCKLS